MESNVTNTDFFDMEFAEPPVKIASSHMIFTLQLASSTVADPTQK
jgi:hypothetical protein